MGVVSLFYTYFGWMRSLVWNDCLQFVIYMVGAIAAVFVIAANIPGGWPELWRYTAEHDKLQMFDFSLTWSNAYNFWAGLIGGAVLTIGTHGTDHMMVQRYLSARSQHDAGRAVFASGLVVFAQFAVFLFIGVELACFYAGDPDLTFEKTDQVFAHFIVHYFPKNIGLVGLMLAAILAAAMSTLSSSLNSSASALVNDFYLPSLSTPLPPERALQVTRNLTLLFGVIQIGVGFWATQLARTVVDNALTIAGFSAGLLLGVYSLGVLTKRVGQTAALSGAAVGLMVLLFVQFGVGSLGVKPIAWPWLALVGASTTFGCGVVFSLLSPQVAEKVEQ
jgi:Na+/proline symporter